MEATQSLECEISAVRGKAPAGESLPDRASALCSSKVPMLRQNHPTDSIGYTASQSGILSSAFQGLEAGARALEVCANTCHPYKQVV